MLSLFIQVSFISEGSGDSDRASFDFSRIFIVEGSASLKEPTLSVPRYVKLKR